MLDIIKNIYKNRKANFEKLIRYGFEKNGKDFLYSRQMSEKDFEMIVTVTSSGEISATIIDRVLNEPYTLHLAEGTAGSFIGGIRMEYEEILRDIAEKCFETDIFKTEYAKQLITYVRTIYGDELEFLWKKSPENAVWRRKDSKKWYGLLLTVKGIKIGLNTEETVEIIDLRMDPKQADDILSLEHYYPGWHMNKKSWYTLVLDGNISYEELKKRIAESYELAAK